MGVTKKEEVPVQQVKENDRNEKTTEPLEVEASTRFTFPGRGGNILIMYGTGTVSPEQAKEKVFT